MKITIVGCGPGSIDYITPAATHAIQKAEVLIGSQRLLTLFSQTPAEKIPIGSDIDSVLDSIAKHCGRGSVAVLVTGDPGIFSLTKRVIERFGRESCEIIPGVSSFQVAFARLGLGWNDARIVSAHKQNPDPEMLESLKNENKLAILAGRRESISYIARLASLLGDTHRIFVCENLTLDDEQLREVSAEQLSRIAASSLTVILIIKAAIFK